MSAEWKVVSIQHGPSDGRMMAHEFVAEVGVDGLGVGRVEAVVSRNGLVAFTTFVPIIHVKRLAHLLLGLAREVFNDDSWPMESGSRVRCKQCGAEGVVDQQVGSDPLNMTEYMPFMHATAPGATRPAVHCSRCLQEALEDMRIQPTCELVTQP